MVPYRLSFASKISQTVQGSMVRMAGSEHQEDGMVTRGRGKASAFGEINAHTMANDRLDCGKNGIAMSGALRMFAVSESPFMTLTFYVLIS